MASFNVEERLARLEDFSKAVLQRFDSMENLVSDFVQLSYSMGEDVDDLKSERDGTQEAGMKLLRGEKDTLLPHALAGP